MYKDDIGVLCSCHTTALICGSLQSTEKNEAEITTIPHITQSGSERSYIFKSLSDNFLETVNSSGTFRFLLDCSLDTVDTSETVYLVLGQEPLLIDRRNLIFHFEFDRTFNFWDTMLCFEQPYTSSPWMLVPEHIVTQFDTL